MSISDKSLRSPNDYLPLSPQELQVLLVLCERPLHGYGIVKASRDETGRSVLDLGTLYRIISRMMRRGLIEDAPAPTGDSQRRRRYYRTTELGRKVARAEALRLKGLLESRVTALLLEDA